MVVSSVNCLACLEGLNCRLGAPSARWAMERDETQPMHPRHRSNAANKTRVPNFSHRAGEYAEYLICSRIWRRRKASYCAANLSRRITVPSQAGDSERLGLEHHPGTRATVPQLTSIPGGEVRRHALNWSVLNEQYSPSLFNCMVSINRLARHFRLRRRRCPARLHSAPGRGRH